MLLLIVVGGFVLFGIVRGICLFAKNPKPPKMLTYADYKQYYDNKQWLTVNDTVEDTEWQKIEKEIEYYTGRIAMLEDLQRIVEKDLYNNRGNYKANLSRLISLDNQIHAAQQKINKLNDELERL